MLHSTKDLGTRGTRTGQYEIIMEAERMGEQTRQRKWLVPRKHTGLNLQQLQKAHVCIGGPSVVVNQLMEMSLSPCTWVLIPPSFKNGVGGQ